MRFRILLAAAVLAALLILPATASAYFVHVVGAGETLSSVAAADGLSVSALAAANGVSPDNQLVAGQSLQIPPQGVAAPAAVAQAPGSASASTADSPSATAASAAAGTGGYRVRPGDTLTGIAAASGLTVAQVAAAAGINPDGVLVSGTTISLGGSPASDASGVTPAAGGAQPTSETVSAADVGSIAVANGVSASLAQAIGWQESGFNNALVSRTGATGVMQIEPGTWSYIGSNLVTPPPLSAASATDNVRGGVLLLRSLLGQTGGDPALAAAGYYQGLESVRRYGMYSDTQRYVNDVMALRSRFGGP